MKDGLHFEEKKELPKIEKSKKLKGIESFQLETEEDITMREMIIPEPILKNNNKPAIIHSRKKDSIF